MSQPPKLCTESSVIWANHVLIASAAIYIYDFILTFSTERMMWRHIYRWWPLLKRLILMRYPALFYQLFVLFGISWSRFNPQTCTIRDNIALSFDTIFQVAYVWIITHRIHVFGKLFISLPMGLLGLVPLVINVVVSNPSVFPECRVVNPAVPSRIVTLVPCFRSVFDALATLFLLFKIQRSKTGFDRLISEVMHEEVQGLAMILSIMAMEAVFAQIPSARNHARNYIVPFMDSITAILAGRLFIAVYERRLRNLKSESELNEIATSGSINGQGATQITSMVRDSSRCSHEDNLRIESNQGPFHSPLSQVNDKQRSCAMRNPPEDALNHDENESHPQHVSLSTDCVLGMPDAAHLRDSRFNCGEQTCTGKTKTGLEPCASSTPERPLSVIEKRQARRAARAVGRLAFGPPEGFGLERRPNFGSVEE